MTRTKVSKQVKSSEDEPKHIVYFACYMEKNARIIQKEILDKTGLLCHIGKIRKDVIFDHIC